MTTDNWGKLEDNAMSKNQNSVMVFVIIAGFIAAGIAVYFLKNLIAQG